MRSLGIDVGGTFTDFVAIDGDGGLLVHKQLTTPADPSVSVLAGAERVAAAAGSDLAGMARVIHGTTLVVNSLIERRGAKTALLTTAGFRDALEIGRESRYDLYDLALERPEPLIARPYRLEVEERLRSDGSVLDPLTAGETERAVRGLRALEVESVAVSLVNSYANPAHEQALGAAIAEAAPEIDVTLSSAVAPEWREYERTSTAAANAFVRPLVKRYLARLDEGLEQLGARDRLYVVLSQGGMTSARVAAELAVQLVESGPAGGVIAASYFGRRMGMADLISFDMGGTTTKVSLVEGGEPARVRELEVARVARFKRGSGLPLKIPAIELVEIGAGGGSLARVDALGLLRVGPASAGAEPGPACYGRGGSEPTVTDADVALGLVDPDYFLGGAMTLDRDRAEAALARLGASLGLDAEGCARGIFEIVNSQMALAMQTHVVERGRDPRRFGLVAFGGAGPVHAYELARRLRIGRVVYPPAAGVASALGFLVAPFGVDLVRTLPGPLAGTDWAGVRARFVEMEAEARDLLGRAGASLAALELERRVDVRYAGQGYAVEVAIPELELGPGLAAPLRTAFEVAYERRFGSHLASASAEALHWRLAARVPVEAGELAFARTEGGDPRKGEREAYFPESGRVGAGVYDRYRLAPGARLDGPVLIEERESTVVVGPSGRVEADQLGNLVLTFDGGGPG